MALSEGIIPVVAALIRDADRNPRAAG